MMKLLTFLGTRPIETTYVMPEGEAHTAPFCGVALAHALPLDEVVVFVTEQAREVSLPTFEERLSDISALVRAVDIPGDATEAELWQIFRAVVGAVENEERVVFDITHGFRSVSFLSFLAAAYLRVVKDIRLEGVYYGNFEARDRSVTPNRAPVIDLTSLAGLLDWMMAANRFERFGDARDLAALLRAAVPPWDLQKDSPDLKEQATRIRRAAGTMERVSRSLRLIRPQETMQASADLVRILPAAAADIRQAAPPFELLVTPVVDAYRLLALDVKGGEAQPLDVLTREREMIGWYVERNQYVQALALAREWLVSWVMAWLGMWHFNDKDARERVERAITGAIRRRRRGKTMTEEREHEIDLGRIPHLEDALTLFDQIGQVRNDLLHAGKRRSPLDAEKAERRILQRCEEIQRLPLPNDEVKR